MPGTGGGPRGLGRPGQQRPDRGLRVVHDRRAVREAKDGEGEVQEALDRSARLRRVVVVAERHEVELAALVMRQEVGAEEDAGLAFQEEGEVGVLRTRRVDRVRVS